MRRIEVHPEALLELESAHLWYRERNELVAQAFASEIAQAVNKIVKRPETWPRTRGNEHRLILQQFPYSIIYRIRQNDLFITAFAHQRRKPNY